MTTESLDSPPLPSPCVHCPYEYRRGYEDGKAHATSNPSASSVPLVDPDIEYDAAWEAEAESARGKP